MTTTIAAVAVVGCTKYVISQVTAGQRDPLAMSVVGIQASRPAAALVQARKNMIMMAAATKSFKVIGKPKVAAVPQPAGGAPVVYAPPPNPGTAQAIAYKMMPSFGFNPATQFGCLNDIWERESGWRYNAENASGAYGIPQALPGSKMASAGPDWLTNPATQIKWGLGYIQSRYGTPCNAWAFWQGHGWY